MPVTDTIADFLTRVRNALKARHKEVSVPKSRMLVDLARILKEEGYIENYKVVTQGPQGLITVQLKHDAKGQSVITGLQRISRGGLRRYAGRDDIPAVYRGLGITIVSTSKGVMTASSARKAGVGGEMLCKVW
jgi:small subunit ribosomal protein S8